MKSGSSPSRVQTKITKRRLLTFMEIPALSFKPSRRERKISVNFRIWLIPDSLSLKIRVWPGIEFQSSSCDFLAYFTARYRNYNAKKSVSYSLGMVRDLTRSSLEWKTWPLLNKLRLGEMHSLLFMACHWSCKLGWMQQFKYLISRPEENEL